MKTKKQHYLAVSFAIKSAPKVINGNKYNNTAHIKKPVKNLQFHPLDMGNISKAHIHSTYLDIYVNLKEVNTFKLTAVFLYYQIAMKMSFFQFVQNDKYLLGSFLVIFSYCEKMKKPSCMVFNLQSFQGPFSFFIT